MRTLFLIAFWSSAALAMNCDSQEGVFENRVARAESIFSGTAVSQQSVDEPAKRCRKATLSDPDCGAKIVLLEVDKVWKGNLGETVRVFFDDACACLGAYVRPKAKLLVFARAAQGKPPGADLVASNTCLGTAVMESPAAWATIVKLKAARSDLK